MKPTNNLKLKDVFKLIRSSIQTKKYKDIKDLNKNIASSNTFDINNLEKDINAGNVVAFTDKRLLKRFFNDYDFCLTSVRNDANDSRIKSCDIILLEKQKGSKQVTNYQFNNALAQISQQLAGLTRTVTVGFNNVNKRLTKVENRLTKVEKDVRIIKADVKKLDKRVTKLEKDVKVIKSDVKKLDKRVTKLETNFVKLKKDNNLK